MLRRSCLTIWERFTMVGVQALTRNVQKLNLQLVLASGSPRRKDLLTGAGYQFAVVPAEVEECEDADLGAATLVLENALLKARWVAERHPGALVLGSDTLVALEDEPLGKPKDLDDAFEMLRRLVGRSHTVLSGVALVHHAEGVERSFVEQTRVTFRSLTEREIREYLGMIDPLDKAGSYAAQDHGEFIIEKTEGSWTNVVGLPMERLGEEMEFFAQR
jgi:septum formation protein